jgi:hypothetical protein
VLSRPLALSISISIRIRISIHKGVFEAMRPSLKWYRLLFQAVMPLQLSCAEVVMLLWRSFGHFPSVTSCNP